MPRFLSSGVFREKGRENLCAQKKIAGKFIKFSNDFQDLFEIFGFFSEEKKQQKLLFDFHFLQFKLYCKKTPYLQKIKLINYVETVLIAWMCK